MKFVFRKPVDIFIAVLWTIISFILVILDVKGAIRVIFGLPFVIFIPGYVLTFALFPGKKDIDIIERIALSFGLSIAVVPLVGLILNYTPFGIRLEPIIVSLSSLVFVLSGIGLYRWYSLPERKRFIISFEFSLPENRIDRVLTAALIFAIVASICLLIYIIATPHQRERFTEFYILGPEGKAEGYPTNLSVNKTGKIIIGIVNHEQQPINYTVEIWLLNETWNESKNESIVHNMWFMGKIEARLNSTPVNIEGEWQPQWEYNYTFSIDKNGTFKLAFLLFKGKTEDFVVGKDYDGEKANRINEAYRECHLWVTVK